MLSSFDSVSLVPRSTALRMPRRYVRALLSLLVTSLPLFLFVAIAAPVPGPWASPKALCNIADRRITEASGIVESRRNPGTFYVHNDSGDTARFFALGRNGATRFVANVANAKNVDWEDIAAARNARGKPVVYLADIGDNLRQRTQCTVYEVTDPPAPRRQGKSISLTARAIAFRYPDGSHDAEALLAGPKATALYVVTKALKGEASVVYRVNPSATGAQTAVRVGEVRFDDPLPIYPDLATGGDISPDGKRIVIRTYQAAYEWTIPDGQTVEQALKTKPTMSLLMMQQQGEAICYGSDGKTLLTTSEQRPAPIYEYKRKAGEPHD